MKYNFGFIKVGVGVPELKVGNIEFNIKEMISMIREANKNKVKVLVFPELSICGYTCGDLFLQNLLLEKCKNGLSKLVGYSNGIDILFFVGMPLEINSKLYNCAIAIHNGKIKGVIPKMYLPNYKEFYEKRWFTEGKNIVKNLKSITLFDKEIPFGNIIFENNKLGYKVGVEICEDLWVTIPPSSLLTLNGANIIVNLSASNECIGKSDYRKNMVAMQSAKGICGYLYASSGVGESTSDIVFGGEGIIAENGSVLVNNEKFKKENTIIYSEIDIERLKYDRNVNKSFADNSEEFSDNKYISIPINDIENVYNHTYQYSSNSSYLKTFHKNIDLTRTFDKYPFVPSNINIKNERCKEIFDIQISALSKRILHTNMKKAIIGVSGGLDSTLALLVIYETFKRLNIPFENIIGVTMPCFGTTNRTYNNSISLMKSLNITIKEINIKNACIQHFKDIEHDINIHDITYENTQARERTQILMDIANKENGLVIGTGDLSELALGWCTYNGDHMSMYAINSGIPKTLVRHLVNWYMEDLSSLKAKKENYISSILLDILDTPVSPELLPPDKEGNISQKTEDNIGSYDLNDFFLYYFIRWGMSPSKILLLAIKTFKDIYSEEEILKWLKVFIKRFFISQFKRDCIPNGVKVGSVSLSPRGDWRMPSDADMYIWLSDLEKFEK